MRSNFREAHKNDYFYSFYVEIVKFGLILIL